MASKRRIGWIVKGLLSGTLATATIATLLADEGIEKTRARTSALPTFGKMQTTVRPTRQNTHSHSKNPSNHTASSGAVRGGLFQQFKAFTGPIFGVDDVVEEDLYEDRLSNLSRSDRSAPANPPRTSASSHRNSSGGDELISESRNRNESTKPTPRDPASIHEQDKSKGIHAQAGRAPVTNVAEVRPKPNVTRSTNTDPISPTAKAESSMKAPAANLSTRQSSRRSTGEPNDSTEDATAARSSSTNETATIAAQRNSTNKIAAKSQTANSLDRGSVELGLQEFSSTNSKPTVTKDDEAPSIPKKQVPSSSRGPSQQTTKNPTSTSKGSGSEIDAKLVSTQVSADGQRGSHRVENSGPKNSASAKSSRVEPSGSDADLSMGIPQVKLKLHGPSAIRVGDNGTYQVIALNEGADTLTGLLIRTGIPNGVKIRSATPDAGEVQREKDNDSSESIIWQLEKVGPYQSKVLQLSLEATRPEHFAIDVEWTVMPQNGQLKVQVHQPQLQMALEGSSEAIFGRPEMYRLRIRNPGNVDVKDVQVLLSAGEFGRNETVIGDVPAGGERLIEVELTFQQPGTIKIEAIAKSQASGLDSKAQIDVAVKQAALSAEWVGPKSLYQGSVGSYSVVVSNASAIDSQNVVCIVSLPTGAHATSLPKQGKVKGQEIHWTIPVLAAAARETFSFELQLNREGDAAFKVAIEGSAGARAIHETMTRVEAISDLKLTVIDPSAPAPVGQPVTYELIVINRGTKTAHDVKVIAQFSSGIEPVNAEGHSHRLVPGQVLFDPIGSIGPGEQISLKVLAEATEPGMHRFRAEVQCEESDVQLLHEESTRYLATSRSDRSSTVLR